MRRFVPALLLLAAAAVSRPQDSTLRLWAVGDGVRVSPLTGKLLENRPDIHRDYPSGDPRMGNAVWDPAARILPLSRLSSSTRLPSAARITPAMD